MNEPIKIFLVDDHVLFREGIKFVLSQIPHFKIVGEAPFNVPDRFMGGNPLLYTGK